jgi:hypothetical protein
MLARIVHIGAAIILYAVAGLEELKILQIAGTDPLTLSVMASGLWAAGYAGPKAKAIILALAVALPSLAVPLPSDAQAAQAVLPAKASAVTATLPCTPTYCVGPYVGGFIAESGGSLNIPATGLSGLASNQLSLGADVGWQYWDDKWFAAAEVVAVYGLMQNGTIPGGGNSGLWGAGLLAKIGYNFFNATAPAGGPQLPTGITPIAAYAILGDWIRPWGQGFAAGGGVEGWLRTDLTVNIDYLHVNYNNAAINPLVNEQSEDLVIGGFHKHFSF